MPQQFRIMALAVRIYRLKKPYAVLETGGTVGERAYGAYVGYIADGVGLVQRCFDVGADLGMVAAAKDAVLAVVGELVCREHAAVAKDAARHVQFDVLADIFLLESSAFEFEPGGGYAVLVAEVLEIAFTGLVAHGAIQRVVQQQEFHNAFAGVQHFG